VRLTAILAALGALLALPGSAAATVTCTKTGTTIEVEATGASEQMTIRRGLGSASAPLLINGSQCSDATISNVDEVTFNAGANAQTVTIDYSGGFLTTGTVGGGFGNFTDFFVNGFGDTTLRTIGSITSGTIVVAGANGIDADIGIGEPDIFPTGLGFLHAQGSNLTEFMSTGGGNGTGGPYTGAALLEGNDGDDQLTAGASATTLSGGAGDDTLAAGSAADAAGGADDDTITGGDGGNELDGDGGRDRISGAGGNDAITGGDGTDTLLGGAGNDSLDGGGGTDAVSWEDVPGPVSASLAAGTATGAGSDTLANAETLLGTGAGDLLTGGPGPETLLGAGGDDTLVDGGGADGFDGGPGADTLSYALAGGPVTADLGAGTASGGDALAGLERLVGGPFGDQLFGTPGADFLAGGPGDDALDPRGGADGVAGAGGADTLLLRDAAPDTGDCGDGSDRAVVDLDGDTAIAC
jgi:Ca2+-binding RTX toxin-like protein